MNRLPVTDAATPANPRDLAIAMQAAYARILAQAVSAMKQAKESGK